MAIQMRRGMKSDFDPQKMLPGEWAVSIDPETENQIIWMCFRAGVVKRMGTYEDFKAQIADATDDIRELYATAFNEIKLYMEGLADATEQNKNISASKAQEAADSASSALSSKTAAASSEQAASQKADKAYTSAANAKRSADSAEEYSLMAKSYAKGESGVREGEEADNSKYYYERTKQISLGAEGALLPMGTVTFSQLDTSEKQSGYMYNIADSFTTDSRFKEGDGHIYPPGTNVYYTPDGYWDCLSGALTDISDKIVNFTEDPDSYEIITGEKTAVLFGKIEKLLNTIKEKAPNFLASGRVPCADRWNSTRYFEGIGTNGVSDVKHLCVCNSASSDAVKTVSVSRFSLSAGARLIVLFKNENTAQNPKIKVTGTSGEGQPIYYKNNPVEPGCIKAGSCIEMVYDAKDSGVYAWNIVGDLTQSQVEDLEKLLEDLERQVTALKEIALKDMEKIEITLNDGYLWIPDSGSIAMQPEPGDCQCADALVTGGEKYMVGTYYSPSGMSEGHLIYAANRIGSHGGYSDVQEITVSLKEGWHEYLVTVPDGCNCLLVNNDYYLQGIEIYGFGTGSPGAFGSPSRSMKILWSGLLQGGYDSSTGNLYKVEFSIPQDCFFNGGKELILAVNGFCPNDDYSTFPLLMAGMCFGAIGDFENVNYPYKCGDFSRYIVHEETYTSGSGNNPANMVIEIHVKKVPDSRYAVCTVQNRSGHFYITSISAVLAE